VAEEDIGLESGTPRVSREAPSPGHPLAIVAEQLLPALVARLGVSGLGELEVRQGDWRVRLRRQASPGRPTGPAGAAVGDAARSQGPGRPAVARGMVTAPAVGYYTPRDGMRVGQPVAAGDVFGWVDVLGVRQDVVAPLAGIVGRLLVAPGQAVEYGQELLQIDPAGSDSAIEEAGLSSEPSLVAARAAD
jgi:methylmalonyl-CoA carboxyltransferase small subunit